MYTTNQLGNIAELQVASYFLENRYEVFMGYGGKTTSDLIVFRDNKLSRVQVKGCAKLSRYGNWAINLKTVTSSKSGNVVKKFDSNDCDILAIYIAPEKRTVILNPKDVHGQNLTTIKSMERCQSGLMSWS